MTLLCLQVEAFSAGSAADIDLLILKSEKNTGRLMQPSELDACCISAAAALAAFKEYRFIQTAQYINFYNGGKSVNIYNEA